MISDPFRMPRVAEVEINGKPYVVGHPEEIREWELRRFMLWKFEKRLKEITKIGEHNDKVIDTVINVSSATRASI